MSCSHMAAAPTLPSVSTPPSLPPPCRQLDLRPYMAAGCQDAAPAHYRLYAVVVHIDWGRSTDCGELGRCAGVGRQ